MTSSLHNDHWLETYKSLVAISMEGFKYLVLINGGAAVALLAYLGNVAANNHAVPDMRCPMLAFLLGLSLCGLALLGSYLTQLLLLNELSKPDQKSERHPVLLWGTILLYVFSLGAFIVGSWQAVVRFN